MKIHHVALTVKDIEQSVRWYCENIGFKEINHYNDNRMQISLLQLDEVKLELFSFNDVEPLPEYRKDLLNDLHTVGTKHLCIAVENLDETIDKLKQKNVIFVDQVDTAAFGGEYIFFKDCNGILIELYQGI